jgi:hypothetical protein
MSSRILDYVLMDEEPESRNLIPFLCIYPFQGDNHNVVIYAHNWSEAHSYASYHGLIVKEKISCR